MWTRDFVKSMKTHENTDGSNETNIEFCYFDNYLQLNENFSTSIISSSPQQAWRAGFREGVKMSLNRGSTIKDLNSLWWQNYNRLLIWTMVGADVQNGLWTIYGAREGLYKTMCTDWDHIQVRDFTYLNQLWNNKQKTEVSGSDLLEAIEVLGQTISTDLQFPIAQMPLDEQQSKFFKTVHSQPSRNMRLKK